MSQISQQEERHRDVLSQPLLRTAQLDLEKTIYLVIFILALITRFWGIGDRVVSHDESLHTQYSYQYFNGEGYQHTPLMHGPTLFHATALSFWIFGDNDASARIPVAILGSILVLLPYFLRDWIGKAGAILASILLLISPYITYYSRYIRHDIYIIVAAVIVFIAIQYYLRRRKDKYIWWFAVGLGLMFATMETAYIYVAIFGSFLVLSLFAKVITSDWFRDTWPRLRKPLALVLLALVLFLAGYIGQRLAPRVLTDSSLATDVATDEGFAANPDEVIASDAGEEQVPASETIFRWVQIGGLLILAGGLFLTANSMRPFIDDYPEFDLVVLFTTLTLPTATAFLIILAGGDPLAYTLKTCQLAGQETMSPAQLFIARVLNATCLSEFLSSPVALSAVFLVLTLVVSVLVGLWWNRRRWLIAAIIFHGIFLLFFTSLFTNPSGWASGMIGSLGYWLEQQEVQRANQPWYFYLIVLPLYEFLPLILTLIAARLWAKKNSLQRILDYFVIISLVALLAYSLINWFYNRFAPDPEMLTRLPGIIAGGTILLVGFILILRKYIQWYRARPKGSRASAWLPDGWGSGLDVVMLFGFVPYLIWWFLATWVIYGYAGEKMAWLSTHYIFPMVLLGGWYVNEKLLTANLNELRTRRFALLVALTALFVIALIMTFSPVILGQINLGNQTLTALNSVGRLIGGLIISGILLWLIIRVGRPIESGTRKRAWLAAILGLLALLTIRFSYTASFRNADYVTEYLVYAHGAPATKSEVMSQLNKLSMRLHGDKTIQVAFDNDSSWPFTWYLRDFPNRLYFGENPGRNIADAPVVIVGSQNWSKVEPILGDEYEERTYTFLWWPMEEYRKFSWNAIFGDPNVEPEFRRGLGNPNVRQAIWDIFFYRDYEKYGEVFGGNYSPGQWPLRHDLRMYIRKDSLATLWDHGIDAIAAEPPVDIYAENELQVLPSLVIGTTGSGDGQLLQPRNVAIGPDGFLYVVDSGNHRVQVFDSAGNYVRQWGEFGGDPGQFNEPWGIAVDDETVFVADTWNHRLQKFTHEGDLVGVIGQSGSPADGQLGGGLFFGPRDVLILPDGNLLVTDTGNHRLQIFDPEGNFKQSLGSQGTLPGQYYEPVGIAAGRDGSIYVVDTWNGRIQKLGPDYMPASEWTVDAWYGESINNKPYLAISPDDYVYVTDPEGYRVLIFDGDGNYVGRFGQFSNDVDGFALPNGIMADGNGDIFVADAGNNRILKYAFDPQGLTSSSLEQ